MRQTPLADITDEAGLQHRLWAITDETMIHTIQQRFTDTKLYIADGHHRYETALNYRNERRAQGAPVGGSADYVMMMLVEMNHPGLVVFPTHRMLRGLENFDPDALLKASEPYFDLHRGLPVDQLDEWLEHAYREGQNAFAFYTGGGAFTLMTLRDPGVMAQFLPGLSPASQQLDVQVLHTLVLERLLGIDKENMAGQKNLTYTRDRQEALDDVDAGAYQCSGRRKNAAEIHLFLSQTDHRPDHEPAGLNETQNPPVSDVGHRGIFYPAGHLPLGIRYKLSTMIWEARRKPSAK